MGEEETQAAPRSSLLVSGRPDPAAPGGRRAAVAISLLPKANEPG